jgi:hypothetical protein
MNLLHLSCLLAGVMLAHASGMSPACFAEFSKQPSTCGAGSNGCAMLCEICARPEFLLAISDGSACNSQNWTDDNLASFLADTLTNVSALQGYRWMDDSGDVEEDAREGLAHLLRFMPRRDILALFSEPHHLLEFFFDHVRYALLARRTFSFAQHVSKDLFLDHVLPYAVINEKRDFWWPWRPRLFEVLSQVAHTVFLGGVFSMLWSCGDAAVALRGFAPCFSVRFCWLTLSHTRLHNRTLILLTRQTPLRQCAC